MSLQSLSLSLPDHNVKHFTYNKYLATTNTFLCIEVLAVKGCSHGVTAPAISFSRLMPFDVAVAPCEELH